MTGEEFIFLSKHASGQAEALPQPVTDKEKKYVYGILGIAKLFGCSLPTDVYKRQGQHCPRGTNQRLAQIPGRRTLLCPMGRHALSRLWRL